MYKDEEKRREYKRAWNQANREKHNAYLRQWRAERQAWVHEQLGGKCVVCGSTDDLHVDHIDPAAKQFSFGQAWNKPIAELQAELAKCQLLCKAHHIEKTMNHQEYHTPAQHGSSAMYGAPHRCRCDTCRLWKRNYDIEWKRRRKPQASEPS